MSALRQCGAHVQEGLGKIRKQPWAEPLGKGLAIGAQIVKNMDGLVPGFALLGGAMSLGASLLKPEDLKEIKQQGGEIRSDFLDIKIEMQSILKNIQIQNLAISFEINQMRDNIKQTFMLVADIKYRVKLHEYSLILVIKTILRMELRE